MILPKPPKLFRTKPDPIEEPSTEPVPKPLTEAPQAWSPTPLSTPVKEEESKATIQPEATENFDRYAPPPVVEEKPETTADEFVPEPEENPTPKQANPDFVAEPTETESGLPKTEDEFVPEPVESVHETESVESESKAQPTIDDSEKYARPKMIEPVAPEISERHDPSAVQSVDIASAPDLDEALQPEENEQAIYKLLGKDQKIIRAESVSSIPFSDIWYTAEKVAYIRDETTRFALVPFLSNDLSDFYKALEQGYTGQSSYAIRFAGESYRVERIITLSGVQYNCRKMPTSVPDIYTLGLPKHVVDYLLTLSREAGLILFGGPTGMGKTTSASALMKKFLEENGGFMYTIEDPPEMPLDGLYHAANGALGLCKQCPVDNERWGDGIKSALRSRPRYILVGEIRTPETASQVLRAATSGHLVLSTIHASTVEDSLESIIKYASGAGLTESLAADLLARGVLAVVHQKLEGATTLRPVITAAFANPHLSGGDQMRSLIRSNTINLQTLIEAQSSRLFQGRPLFDDEKGNKK